MARELLKWLGEDGMEEFRTLLNKIWETLEVPEEWGQVLMTPERPHAYRRPSSRPPASGKPGHVA